MRGPGSLRGDARRHRWAAALLLGAAGYLLNLFPVPLAPGTDMVFGGVAYLLAAVALGPLPGLLAAAIASIHTVWLWGHPYAWLIFSAEALAVGYLTRRRGLRPMVADLAYWIVGGVPLLLLTYGLVLGVRGDTAAIIFLKQPLNGLISAVLAETLFLLPPVRRALGVPGAPRLRSALAAVVTLAAVTPALAFGIWVGRQEWHRNVDRARERLGLFSQSYASKLEQYVLLHERAVRSVAQAAERRGELSPEQLQRLISAEHEQFRGFVEMYAADSRGVVVAAHPLTGARGDTLPGADLSDRDLLVRLRETRETVISDVHTGHGGAEEPRVVVAHPIVLGDTVAGYVLGALDLKAFPIPAPAPLPEERLRVADPRGTLVFDSGRRSLRGAHARVVDDSIAFAAVRATPAGETTTYGAGGEAAPPAAAAERILAGVDRIPTLGWWVWVEAPFSRIQAFVGEAYVRLFLLLIAVTLAALGISDSLAFYLARPLLRIRAAAGRLAGGDLRARVGRFPPGAPLEIEELGRGFDEMAGFLAGRTEELEELGEIARSLASTLEAEELLRRVTDAAVRLVEPDGCGMALLDRGGETLRAARYTLGLLAPMAGAEIPAGRSLPGWVVREGVPVLVHDAAEDSRVLRTYVDVSRVGSVVCAPLVGRSGPLGALTAVRARSNPDPFTDADLQLLDRLARHAAVAVENARLLEAAQAASRAKSNFIATMSHELRTPLNAVLGHLQLLEMEIHGRITAPQREALQRIGAASRHLRGLIEEVLSFARLEAGRLEVHVGEADLCALAEEVAAVIEPLAREKEIAFEMAPCLAPEVVPTDADKVRQILINLAGNAVKFTERGRVRIRVERRGSEVVLAVEDTGPGIAPEDRARLFRPFEQLESGFARSHGGTGLGLYLSGEYARLVGGRIEVESEPGRGSTFSLVLPAQGPPPRENADEETAAPAVSSLDGARTPGGISSTG